MLTAYRTVKEIYQEKKRNKKIPFHYHFVSGER